MNRIAHLENLSSADQELVKAAYEALDQAYAPYSKFRVGAAIRLSNQVICIGSNQENASYPLCMCGERVAAYHAISKFPNEIFKSMALVCKNEQKSLEEIGTPCGACRQVLREYEMRFESPLKIILAQDDLSNFIIIDSVKELLPYGFDGSLL